MTIKTLIHFLNYNLVVGLNKSTWAFKIGPFPKYIYNLFLLINPHNHSTSNFNVFPIS